jgi:hypothetical protein
VQQDVGGSGDVDERWRGEERRRNATTKEREELYLGRNWNGRNKGIVPSLSMLVVRLDELLRGARASSVHSSPKGGKYASLRSSYCPQRVRAHEAGEAKLALAGTWASIIKSASRDWLRGGERA